MWESRFFSLIQFKNLTVSKMLKMSKVYLVKVCRLTVLFRLQQITYCSLTPATVCLGRYQGMYCWLLSRKAMRIDLSLWLNLLDCLKRLQKKKNKKAYSNEETTD
jgi:hypothetical protein